MKELWAQMVICLKNLHLGESFDNFLIEIMVKMVLAQTINKELWNGSLKVLSNYSIKNADSMGAVY